MIFIYLNYIRELQQINIKNKNQNLYFLLSLPKSLSLGTMSHWLWVVFILPSSYFSFFSFLSTFYLVSTVRVRWEWIFISFYLCLLLPYLLNFYFSLSLHWILINFQSYFVVLCVSWTWLVIFPILLPIFCFNFDCSLVGVKCGCKYDFKNFIFYIDF